MKKFSLEKIVLISLGVSFFIGVWHAFPLVSSIVNDEMYYVGGVLRAIESHRIIPFSGDVPYGTLTYLVDYVFIGAMAFAMLAIFRFNILSLKLFLAKSPAIMYLAPRLTSALFALGILFIAYRMLKSQFEDVRVRVGMIVLLFTNVLVMSVFHTGKVWCLSMFLAFLSYYFCILFVKNLSDAANQTRYSYMFWSLLTGFLAAANFPIFGFSLLNIPIFVWFSRENRVAQKKLLVYGIFGILIFGAVALFNFQNIYSQIASIFTYYRPLGTMGKQNSSLLSVAVLNLLKVVVVFPFLLLAILSAAKESVRDRSYLYISSVYFACYFILISAVATWPSGLNEYLRYILPLGFFLFGILMGLHLKWNTLFFASSAVSAVFFLAALFYLSAPTSYNLAFSWIHENINQKNIVIVNRVSELDLPKNSYSYSMISDEYCATKCQLTKQYDLDKEFFPLIVDEQVPTEVKLPEESEAYFIDTNPPSSGFILVKSFKVVSGDNEEVSIDSGLGNIWTMVRLHPKLLGKNIYISKAAGKVKFLEKSW